MHTNMLGAAGQYTNNSLSQQLLHDLVCLAVDTGTLFPAFSVCGAQFGSQFELLTLSPPLYLFFKLSVARGRLFVGGIVPSCLLRRPHLFPEQLTLVYWLSVKSI